MKVSRPISPILNPKIGCRGNVPWAIGKMRVKSVIYDHTPTMWWKFGENRSGGSWDNLSEMFILKKEKTGVYAFHPR